DRGRLLAEAEAIKAVTQVLDQFLPELGRYEVRISHRAIERAMYDSVGLGPSSSSTTTTGASLAAAGGAGAAPSAATAAAAGSVGGAAGAAGAAAGGTGAGGAGGVREVEVAARRLLATALRGSPMLGAVRGELRYKSWPSVKAGLDGLGLPADRVARCKRGVCELPGDAAGGGLGRLRSYLQEVVAAAAGGGGGGMQQQAAAGGAGAGAGAGAAAGAAVPLPGALAAALEEVAVVAQLLDVWGVPASQVVLDPLMSPAAEYYSGVIFQVHLLGLPAASGTQGGALGSGAAASPHMMLGTGAGHHHAARPAAPLTPGMVAVGGRYDALLRALWAATPHAAVPYHLYGGSPPPGAVGATLNVERLIVSVSQQRAAAAAAAAAAGGGGSGLGAAGGAGYYMGFGAGVAGGLEASKADVLVCARGGDGALAQRMALVSALWSAGVRAELMPRLSPSLGEQYAYAQARGVRAVVILGDKEAAAHDVKIKSLDKRGESVVLALQEAPRYLAAALAGPYATAGRGLAAAVAAAMAHAGGGGGGGGGGGFAGGLAAASGAAAGSAAGQRQSGGLGGLGLGGGGGMYDIGGGGGSMRERGRGDRDRAEDGVGGGLGRRG
ncbi:hypothetical protein Agub_g90, partial [Astrephomene gubernaculifera]